ncbi:hypothetical protein V7P28_28070, partial [Klebsiella michiganensis]
AINVLGNGIATAMLSKNEGLSPNAVPRQSLSKPASASASLR